MYYLCPLVTKNYVGMTSLEHQFEHATDSRTRVSSVGE